MKRQPGAMVVGLGLFLTGGWIVASNLLAGQFGGRPAGFQQLWPVLLAVLGLAMLIQYAFQEHKQGGLIFVGTILLLMGAFFSLFTLRIANLRWADLIRLWPILPLNISIGFMALYVMEGMQDQAVMITVFLLGGIGLLALPLTLGVLRGTAANQIVQMWPVIVLIVVGLLFRPRSSNQGKKTDDG